MDFYAVLSRYYDVVFPMGEPQRKFFHKLIEEKGITSVLDMACGTGTYTLELASQGIRALGIDLSQEMIDLAREKAAQQESRAEFQVGDMLALSPTVGTFDLVMCIGNSLVHLLSPEAIGQALEGFTQVLNPQGTLVLQIVNYDRVLDQHLPGLPVISRPQVPLTFERNYHYRADGLLDFESVLTVGEDSWRSSVPLLPLRREQLEQLVQAAGLTVTGVYGDFHGNPVNDQSQPLVLVAQKGCGEG